ncbi:MAG: GNAT family N-acetyltransferase [Verrucomicrobiota bacterium]
MGDLLVPLYAIEEDLRKASAPEGFRLQRPLSADRSRVIEWVRQHFSDRWADEVAIAFSGPPLTCHVALNEQNELVGFACYDVSWKGFFGPTGVSESCRGKGIGTALLKRALHSMRESGYAYAVIGYSGADEYYGKAVKAIPIPDSEPGAYREWIAEEGKRF